MAPAPVVVRPLTSAAAVPVRASVVVAMVPASAALPLFTNQLLMPLSNPPLTMSSVSAADEVWAANGATRSAVSAAVASDLSRNRPFGAASRCGDLTDPP